MDLSEAVRKAAEENGVGGVMDLSERCDLSYERVSRVWRGDKSAKIADVELVMKKLGYVVSFRKQV